MGTARGPRESFRAILEREKGGWTALHWAAYRCDVEAVRGLLPSAGCSIDAADAMGRTALHVAAHTSGSAAVAEALLAAGANPLSAGLLRKGVTPLHVAAFCGNQEVAVLLLDRGGCAEARDAHRLTPVHNAAAEGHAPVLQLLLDRGGDADAKDEDGATPLYFAAKSGHANAARVLIDRGARVDEPDTQGNTPLVAAANAGCVPLVRLLVNAHAKVDAKGKAARTPLFWATAVETAEALVEAGAAVQARDQWGNSPLHVAAERGNAPLVEFLLARGADANAMNGKGRTALHWAADRQVVEVLLRNGADPVRRDKGGMTPRDVAQTEGRRDVAKALGERTGRRRWWSPW